MASTRQQASMHAADSSSVDTEVDQALQQQNMQMQLRQFWAEQMKEVSACCA
jgi:hypothetical protein